MDDEYLDENENLEDSYILQQSNEDEDSDPFSLDEDEGKGGEDGSIKLDEDDYGKFTDFEIKCITAYSNIKAVMTSEGKKKDLPDSVAIVVDLNPAHTSSITANYVLKEIFGQQAHNRMQNLQYSPDGLITGRQVDDVLETEDSSDFNEKVREKLKEQISRFVEYLANRDLSKDSVVSRKKKQRQLPALIILLLSSGNLYDFAIDCPTMPKVYQRMINLLFNRINKMKADVIEDLAKGYEEAGRQKVADRVREQGIRWFKREPAEIPNISQYKDLNLTQDDINIYKKYRTRWTNLSYSLTQDIVSEYIHAVEDEKKGIERQLKDRVRADAITDVKKLFKEWVANYDKENEDIANNLIFP